MNESYRAAQAQAEVIGQENERAQRAETEGSPENVFKKLSQYRPVMNEVYASLYEERMSGQISFDNGKEDEKILSLLDKCSQSERVKIGDLAVGEHFAVSKNTTSIASEIAKILLSKEKRVVH